MPLLVKAELERKLRWWFCQLVNASPPTEPTEKCILSLYVSTVDRMIRLNNDLLQKGIELAATEYDGCSPCDVIKALEKAIQKGIPKGRRAKTATHILEAVVARIAHQSDADDRVRIDSKTPQVLDFLDEWFRCQPSDQQREQPGGAPAIIAQVLTQLGEPNVALWTAYHSEKQASAFDEEVKFLVIEDRCHHSARPIRSVGRSKDPEIRNYSLEFAKGTKFQFERSDSTTVSITASVSDRVIAIASDYRFFDPSGCVETSKTIPPDIAHILAADPQYGPSCAAQVAQGYQYWIIGGLHNVSDPALQKTLESDLQQVPPDVTIHIEISRPDISLWFQHVLRRYVNSVSVNVDDIERLVQKMVTNEPPRTNPPYNPSIPGLQKEYLLRLVLWLACELDLERVYVHGLELDYVVRRHVSDNKVQCYVSDAEMHQEVRSGLLAKTVVTNRARDAGVLDRPPDEYGLPASNLEAFIEVCAIRSLPLQEKGRWATLAGHPEFERILDRGWFDDTFECQGQQTRFRVALIPVALFRFEPGGLKWVGAGDTTSAASFIFGCFTTQGTKRCP